jgi:hypothetical protein
MDEIKIIYSVCGTTTESRENSSFTATMKVLHQYIASRILFIRVGNDCGKILRQKFQEFMTDAYKISIMN